MKENNQSRGDAEHDSQIQWIRVIEMEKGNFSPIEDRSRRAISRQGPLPVRAPALRSKESTTTNRRWSRRRGSSTFRSPACSAKSRRASRSVRRVRPIREPDGVVVIDYNWCIGCRMCITACPYWARRFNWGVPNLPAEELNPTTHYLGNRPRMMGVAEKCTFCLQRTRKGRYTACVEGCTVGARKFGNLLDPKSEVRKVIENKRVFRLKAELNTYPKFFYFID